ncbi:MAG: TetR family transcriptional regulator [Alphaproteobacteria bacterium]|nr:TetR family transcriptional regulator [Alphaproteobacteria bacterium]
MVRKTKEEKENTRLQILQAALDCFYEKGFSKTSFDDIATLIGMTKGAVYWHFKDKGDLLVELIKQRLEIKAKNSRGNNPSPANLQELRDFFAFEANYLETHPALQKFIFFTMLQVEWSDAIFNKVLSELGDIRKFHVTTVYNALLSAQKNGEISPTIDIKETAQIIANMWKGAIHFYVSERNANFSIAKNFINGLDIILNWLKKEGK